MTDKHSATANWHDDLASLNELYKDVQEDHKVDVGISPKVQLYKENKLRLYQYEALPVKQKKTPLLIVYALVNRPFITDLQPDRSLVLRLLEAGYPVFLIDWGYPDESDKFTSLDDYINGYLYRCMQQIHRHTNSKKIDLLGVCQGGVFSLCYSALYPESIRKVITLVTPINFHCDESPLSHWVSGIKLPMANASPSNIPGKLLTHFFKAMRPYLLNRDKYRDLSKRIKTSTQLETFLRMEKWINDSPDLAGKAATEFIEKFYQKNGFLNDNLTIGKKTVQLNKITSPVLNLFAENDHIVPASSSQALAQLVKPDLYTESTLEGGHIGAFTRVSSQKKLITTLKKWLG